MIKHTLLIAALLTSTAAFAGPSFSGTIDIKVSAPQGAGGTAKLHVSDTGAVASEVDMGGPPPPAGVKGEAMHMKMRTLVKKDGDTMYVIDDASKTYREVDMKQARQAAARPDEKWTVKKVGSEKLNGWNTTHVTATSSAGANLEIWTTNDIGGGPAFTKVFTEQAKMPDSLTAELKKAGADGIPAKMVTKTPNGDVTTEIVNVSKTAPDAKLFDLPKDYKKAEMPPMMPPAAQQPAPAPAAQPKVGK